MTDQQFFLAMISSALSGGVVGLFAARSIRRCAIGCLIVIALHILGCSIYGSIVMAGIPPTASQLLGGCALAAPGFLIFLGVPAAGACVITAAATRLVQRRFPPGE
jgi:hypothetical protein